MALWNQAMILLLSFKPHANVWSKFTPKGYKYHKAGIMLLDLVPSSYKQMEMFDTEETQARSKLMKPLM